MIGFSTKEVYSLEKWHRCGKYIKQINDELRKNANNAMLTQDMTMVQLEALIELSSASEGQCTLKELEQKLHVAQSTAAGIVSRLEQKGFVTGFADASDRRIKLVHITQTGLERVQNTQQHMIETEARLLSCLTETERDIFCALLEKVSQSLH